MPVAQLVTNDALHRGPFDGRAFGVDYFNRQLEARDQ